MIAGRFLMDLAEVLALNGKRDEAVRAMGAAVHRYAAKGSLPSVRDAERALDRLTAGA